MSRYKILFILLVLPVFMFGQDEKENMLMFSGQVTDYFSEEKLSGISVKVMSDGEYYKNMPTDGKGEYEFYLDFEKNYVVLYEKAGYEAKKIEISTKGVPPKERNKIADLVVEMTMFKKDKDLNVAFLSQPIGKAKYDSRTKEIDWDMGYTAPIAGKLTNILESYVEQKKAKEEAEKMKARQYAQMMKDADKQFFNKNYKEAKGLYQKALAIDPDQIDPKLRIGLIDKAIEKQKEQERLKKEEEERAAAEAKAKAEAEAAAKKQEEERIAKEKAEAEAKAKAEAEAKAKAEAEVQAKKEEEERIAKEKAEAEARAQAEAEAKAKAEAEAAAKKAEEERIAKEKAEAEAKAKAEAEAKAKAEAEAAAKKQEEERIAKEKAEAEAKAKAEAEAKAKAEAEAQAKKEEEERIAKEKAEAEAKAAAEAEEKARTEQYNALISAGDEALKNNKYDEAKNKYNEALQVKPNENYPKEKIKEIEDLLAKLAQKEKEYTNTIAAADKSFAEKKYEDARKNYQIAIKIQPDENYPKERIREIDAILAELDQKEAAQKALQEKYNIAVADADKAFNKKDYENAKSKYNEAKNILPAEVYPIDKIKEIDVILAEIAQKEVEKLAEAEAKAKLEAEQKAKEDQYNQLIAIADKAFNAKNYNEAKTTYLKALDIKPEEKYPKNKIKETDEILATLAQQEIRQKKLDEKYNNYIISADNAFVEKSYNEAINNYQEALKLKAEENYPKEKIAEINSILAEIANNEANAKAEAEAAAKKQEEERIAKEKAEAEAKVKAEAEAKAKAEKEAAEKLEKEEKMAKEKAEEEAKARAEAEAKAKAEAEAQAKKQKEERLAKEKAEAEAKAKAEAQAQKLAEKAAKEKEQEEKRLAKEKAEAEAAAKKAAEAQAKKEKEASQQKEKEEKLAKEKAEAEAKARAEAEAKAKAESEAQAKKQEEERLAKEKAMAEAKKAEEERLVNEKAIEEMNKKIAEEQAKQEALEKKRAEEEAKRRAEFEAEQKRKEEERKKIEAETGFKLKGTSTTVTNTKKGKLSKGAKKLGGGNKRRIKF